MRKVKVILNERYVVGDFIREPETRTWFSAQRVAPALYWLLGMDRYSPTAESLASYLTEHGYQIKTRTIKDWRMRYKTPEQVWGKIPALAIQLIVEAYNETRYELQQQ